MTTLLLLGIGMQEVLLIGLIFLLLFGGKKIPELMKGLGKGVKSFKDGVKGIEDVAKCPVSYSRCCSAIYNPWILFQGSAFCCCTGT